MRLRYKLSYISGGKILIFTRKAAIIKLTLDRKFQDLVIKTTFYKTEQIFLSLNVRMNSF